MDLNYFKITNNSLFILGITYALFNLCVSSAYAEELKYRPTNPSFGGNPFNGQYLLSNATAQRQHDPPDRKRDPLEEFSDSIKRSVLSRVSREVADQILGENAKDSGHFEVGDVTIDFHRDGDEVVIDIKDPVAGGETTVQIPYPQY